MSVTLTGELAPPDVATLLRGMLQDLSPATQQLLQGQAPPVIDGPPALPETTP